jgi:hypothetical protein
MFSHFIKHWVNGVCLALGVYVCLTLKMIFFFFCFFLKDFRKFPKHIKVGNNEVGQMILFLGNSGYNENSFVLYNQPQMSKHQNSPLLRVRENLAI